MKIQNVSQYCRNYNYQRQMNNVASPAQSKRHHLRQKLKGSLNCFKLNPIQGQARNIEIGDRTPVPGIMANHFEDSFELGRKLGEGASGCVFECKSKTDGKTYAVKISRGDVELLRISKRTFKIMKRLNHPNILKAKCLYLNEVSEKIHFVMEYSPYPSLQSIQSQLNQQQKKYIVHELVKTLTYLHSEGVCHRDIKLENILYSQQEAKIKLIDFGISKKTVDKSREFREMWTSTGTLRYMAPEMLSGSAYDLKVDMWALGVMTYKLFYGKFPFESEYQSDLIDLISNSEPDFDEKNTVLNDLIKHLLCKEPKNRLSASQCLRHPWFQNQFIRSKPRLGSRDDIQTLMQMRIRNYSVGYLESPELKCSREDRIQDLKQTNIFQEKRVYSSFLPAQ